MENESVRSVEIWCPQKCLPWFKENVLPFCSFHPVPPVCPRYALPPTFPSSWLLSRLEDDPLSVLLLLGWISMASFADGHQPIPNTPGTKNICKAQELLQSCTVFSPIFGQCPVGGQWFLEWTLGHPASHYSHPLPCCQHRNLHFFHLMSFHGSTNFIAMGAIADSADSRQITKVSQTDGDVPLPWPVPNNRYECRAQ